MVVYGGSSQEIGQLINVEYHADLKEVQCDAQLSRALSPAMQSAPFDRLEWWQGLVQHCGLTPRLAVARDGDALVALPLAQEDGKLASLANWYTFRFRPVCSGTGDREALLRAIAADLADKTHRINLSGVPDEDGSASALEQAFRHAGWHVTRAACDTNHVLSVKGRSWEEYKASLPGKLRTTLKRKTSKVDCRVLTHFDADVWRDYEDIYASSWKPEEGSPAFLKAFAEHEGAAGRLRLAVAHARDGSQDGKAIAAQMWTVEGETAFIHKLAHREDAKPLSPGSILSAALFRHVIDKDKVTLVDFGTGDDRYKRDWMDDVRPRFELCMMRAGHPRNWLIFAKTGLRLLAGRRKHG